MWQFWVGWGITDASDLYKGRDVKAMEVLKAVQRMAEAIKLLLDNGHQVPALMLVYASIDQVAWLSIHEERSSREDFIRWVDKYMLVYDPMCCTARELWEARNGLLHMSTAESDAMKKNQTIRKIYYTFGGVVCTRNDSTDAVIVSVDELVRRFVDGTLLFFEDLKKDVLLESRAFEKLGQTLTTRRFTQDA